MDRIERLASCGALIILWRIERRVAHAGSCAHAASSDTSLVHIQRRVAHAESCSTFNVLLHITRLVAHKRLVAHCASCDTFNVFWHIKRLSWSLVSALI